MFGILLLILCNLAFGYALAVFFHRPDLLNLSWWTPGMAPLAHGVGAVMEGPLATPTLAPPSKAATPPIPPREAVNVEVVPQPPPQMLEAIEPKPESPASPLDELVEAEITKFGSQVAAAGLAATVWAMETDLNRYCQQLGELDEDVRKRHQDLQSKFVQACVAKFDQISDTYVAKRDQHIEQLSGCEDADALALAGTCREAAQRQSEAIETTRSQLTMTGSMADAAAACRRTFLLATEPLAAANQAFQGELQLVRSYATDGPQADTESETESVAPTSVAVRHLPADLEGVVGAFIDQLPIAESRFSAALIGVDGLDAHCQQHGQIVGDRILQAIAKSFTASSPVGALASDPHEQQFLYLLPDVGSREMTKEVEQLRQRIHVAIFQHKELQLRVTLSCGVAEADGEEDAFQIIERLRNLKSEAERYGRNRTFFQDGNQSAPAVPPVISVEQRVIEV